MSRKNLEDLFKRMDAFENEKATVVVAVEKEWASARADMEALENQILALVNDLWREGIFSDSYENAIQDPLGPGGRSPMKPEKRWRFYNPYPQGSIDDLTIRDEGLEINLSYYAGCGETDWLTFTIPYDWLNRSVEDIIKEWDTKHSMAVEAREAEKWAEEKKEYERLREKYGDD